MGLIKGDTRSSDYSSYAFSLSLHLYSDSAFEPHALFQTVRARMALPMPMSECTAEEEP